MIPSPIDGQAASTEMLRADLKAARGGVVLAETMASGYGDKAVQARWRIGLSSESAANPPDVLRALASETGERLMECMWSAVRAPGRKLSWNRRVVRHSVFGCIVTRPLLRGS